MEQYSISFIGAGKVAKALCQQFYNTGFRIHDIVSKSGATGLLLADLCNATPKSDLGFTEDTDIIIVAIPDDAVQGVLKNISCGENAIVAHTAGSLGLDIFPSRLKHTGVFYPLQTFSADRELDFKDIPFFLEASDTFTSEVLSNLAGSISEKINFADAEHRRLLHISAVFVSNFTNYMLSAGKKVAGDGGFEFEILRPLINETISKALDRGPELSQTGPAFRNDQGTIDKHLALLSFSPDLQNLYKEITKSIMSFYNKKI